jgi:hypothetical protein
MIFDTSISYRARKTIFVFHGNHPTYYMKIVCIKMFHEGEWIVTAHGLNVRKLDLLGYGDTDQYSIIYVKYPH